MAGPHSPSLAAILLLLLHLPFHDSQVSATSATTLTKESSSTLKTNPLSTSTCPSKTINYLTHTLPQQCLRTSRGLTHDTASAVTQSASPDAFVSTSSTPHLPKISQSGGGQEGSDGSDGSNNSRKIEVKHGSTTESVRGAFNVETQTIEITISSAPPKTISSINPAALPSVVPDAETELDSPLDKANFLSFEEWRKQNLARAGQSVEQVGQKRGPDQGLEARRRTGNFDNALDSLGEETEIDLDFGGFVRTPSGPDGQTHVPASGRANGGHGANGQSKGSPDIIGEDKSPSSLRSENKDAGKTCKERSNYASFDCAATILKTNPKCRSSTSILVENKDRYMLNECSEGNKFFIVELCDTILVDTVVLANFEFFSSIFRTFRVSVSDRYPVKADKWRYLGTFEARNTRDVQAFLVRDPMIWAKYVRIEFLMHYGKEYYCPVSLLRIHGTTMMEEFRHGNELARGEDEMEDERALDQPGQSTDLVKTAPTRPNTIIGVESSTAGAMKIGPSHEPINPSMATGDNSHLHVELSDLDAPGNGHHVVRLTKGQETNPLVCKKYSDNDLFNSYFKTSLPVCHAQERSLNQSIVAPANSLSTSKISRGLTTPTSGASVGPSVLVAGTSRVSEAQSSHRSSDISETSVPRVTAQRIKAATNLPETASRILPTTSQNATRAQSSSTYPSHAQPTTQENFFKTIHKRLQFLESNSTLSLQYIEEQSRILRDAFIKVESRQLAKTAKFLEVLNATVLNELRGFRIQYDQIWQSTVIELENQREQSQREIMAVSTRLGILADEVVFQKRMFIVQSVLLLVCIGLVIFSRNTGSNHLELPMIQNMLTRLPSTLRMPTETPTRSRSPVSVEGSPSWIREKYATATDYHERAPSADLSDEARSPTLDVAPPTPSTLQTLSESEDTDEDIQVSSPDAVPVIVSMGTALEQAGTNSTSPIRSTS